jgi:hypothetical protein
MVSLGSNDGTNKKGEDYMKNIMTFILTFVATAGLIGNAFAVQPNSWIRNDGYSGQPVQSVIPIGKVVKLGGVQTLTGEVISVGSNNAYIVKDQYDGITVTVLTDSPLSLGQVVTVRGRAGSTVAQLVTEKSSRNTEIPMGMVSYNREKGGFSQTNMGVVKSINSKNNVFVIENKHCPLTTVVSTDSETMVSLHIGQVVSAKLNPGSNRAISVGLVN